ncbi:MAG: vWA domain-containing protein [Acidimicrobiales bacterium]
MTDLRTAANVALPPERQASRNLVVLLLDASGSMQEPGSSRRVPRIDELNNALQSFAAEDMHAIPQLEANGEIAIGVFSGMGFQWLDLGQGDSRPPEPFAYAAYVNRIPALVASGATPMDQAILGALEAIGRRKRSLANEGRTHESRPIVFLLTDGHPTEPMHDALTALREAERSKAALFFALGTGQARTDWLELIAPEAHYPLRNRPLRSYLEFVSTSMSAISGIDDSAEAIYRTVRVANSRANQMAQDFLET